MIAGWKLILGIGKRVIDNWILTFDDLKLTVNDEKCVLRHGMASVAEHHKLSIFNYQSSIVSPRVIEGNCFQLWLGNLAELVEKCCHFFFHNF